MKKMIVTSIVLGLVAVGQVQAATYPLSVGRGINAGTVDVTSDGTKIYVSFNTTDGWVLGATEVHIAKSPGGIPQNRYGLLNLGRFMGRHPWLRCAGRDLYTFPINNLGGQDFCVVAHAIIARTYRHRLQIEDAWGGASNFPGRTCAKYTAVAAKQWVSAGSGWDVTGDWTFMLTDGFYRHDLSLEQDAGGAVTGTGWLMTDDEVPLPALAVSVTGSVTDDSLTLVVTYPASPDVSFTLEGTIGEDGTISGTCPELVWSWWTTSGEALQQAGGLWTLP
jgi:hypothetical protein